MALFALVVVVVVDIARERRKMIFKTSAKRGPMIDILCCKFEFVDTPLSRFCDECFGGKYHDVDLLKRDCELFLLILIYIYLYV